MCLNGERLCASPIIRVLSSAALSLSHLCSHSPSAHASATAVLLASLRSSCMSSLPPPSPPARERLAHAGSSSDERVDAAAVEPAAETVAKARWLPPISLYFYRQLVDVLGGEDGGNISGQQMRQQLRQRLLLKHNFPLDALQITTRFAAAKNFAVQDETQRIAVAEAHQTWEAHRAAFREEQARRRQLRAAQRSRTRHAAPPADSDTEFDEPEPTLGNKTALQDAMLAAHAAVEQQRDRFERARQDSKRAEKEERKQRRTQAKRELKRAALMQSVSHLSPYHLSSSSSASSSSTSSPSLSAYCIYAQSMVEAAARQERMEQRLLDAISRREEAERRREEATAEYRARKLQLLATQRSTESERLSGQSSNDDKENEHPNTSS